MKSKTSFFNRTVFKKNVTLYWPIWVCYLLYGMVKVPGQLWSRLQQQTDMTAYARDYALYNSLRLEVDVAAIAIMAVVCGMALFGYLFTQKNAYMIHALPVTRGELYVTNMISGLCFLLIPQALVFLVAISIAVLATAICYLMLHRKQREKLYTEEIRKSAEKARKANEAKTRFLFNMSHDIRTPMNAIVGFSGLLEKSIHDEKKSLDYIKKIRVSSDILLTIINQVLEMARIESGKITLNPESVNIREMVEAMNTVFESSLTKKSLEYQCSLNVVHDQILCDKTKMEEIILNVVSNSIKYTNPHGKITVSIDELDSEDEKNANYKVVVEDNGIGMSQDYLPHIFEEFSREHTSTETRVAGTGLGLPIVKSLVDRMGGTIEVESEEGKGTRFIMKFYFPVSLENQVREKEKQNIPDITEKLEGKRILLAEDNELNAEIAETVLEETGIKVKHVEDGIQCIEELKKMPEKYYDVILMDVQMPNMDGYTATQRIRDLDDSRAEIPIIAMTANAYDEDRRKAQEAGMDGFLAKPLDVDEMMRLLAQIIKTE